MADQTETYTAKIILEAKEAIERAKELELGLQKIKFEVNAIAQASKSSYEYAAQAASESYAKQRRSSAEYFMGLVEDRKAIEKEISNYTKQANKAASELKKEDAQLAKTTSEIKKKALNEEIQLSKQRAAEDKKAAQAQLEAQKSTKGFIGTIQNLGSTAKAVFAGVFGITVIGILRSVVQWFSSAVQSGKEFAQSMYKLSVGARAMQRVGVDITIKDIYENIDKLRNKFGIFTTKELVEGTAQLLNLTRTFRFTKEQIFEMQDAISTLAIVNGRAMDDVQRVVALALSSGYTEGLQRLGISINKVTIAQKAATLGWEKGYNALTEYQRAEATRLLILERTAAYEEDLADYQETAPGRIDKATKSWEEFSNNLGTKLLPTYALMSERLFHLIPLFEFIADKFGFLANVLIGITDATVTAIDALVHGSINSVGEYIDVWGKKFMSVVDELEKFREEALGSDYEGPQIEDYLSGEATAGDELEEAMQDAAQDTLKAQQDYEEEAEKLKEQHTQEMLDIQNDYVEEVFELFETYNEKLADIEQKAAEKREDAARKLAQDIEDVNRDYNEKLRDENEDYRQAEIQAERDYQEELRKLREEFLFDLEDALRKRDASQIMRLIRRYNLDKAQLDREKDQDRQEREEDHRQEMEDIRRWRDEKLRELQIEHQRKLEEIEIQAQRERDAAWEAYDEARKDAAEAYEKEKAEQEAQHKQDLEDLKTKFGEILAERLIQLGLEYNLTDTELKKLGELYTDMFGEGGVIEGEYTYFSQMSANITAQAMRDLALIRAARDAGLLISAELASRSAAATAQQQSPYYTPESNAYDPWIEPIGKASGGRLVATRPTLVLFGESGQGEVADFTPLNQMGNSDGGKANIRVSLAPGLIAEVIDSTMDQMANVQIEVQR